MRHVFIQGPLFFTPEFIYFPPNIMIPGHPLLQHHIFNAVKLVSYIIVREIVIFTLGGRAQPWRWGKEVGHREATWS